MLPTTVTGNLRRGRSQCFFCPQCRLVSSYRLPLLLLCLVHLFHTCAYTCLVTLPAFAHLVQSCSSVSSASYVPVGYGPMHYELPPTVRGGLCVHRPSDNCDGLVLSKKRKLTAAAGSTRKRACPEDERFLEYLTLRHQGNVDTAQLSLLVASSAGRGTFHCDENGNAVYPKYSCVAR